MKNGAQMPSAPRTSFHSPITRACLVPRASAGTFRASCRDIGTLRPLLSGVPIMALSATLTLSAKNNVHRLLNIAKEPLSVDVTVPLDRPEIFITQVDVINLTSGGWEPVRIASRLTPISHSH